MYVSRWISVFGELRWLAHLFDPSYMDNFCLLCWSIIDQLHLTFSSQISYRCQDVTYACRHGTPVIVSNNRNNGLIISLSHDNKLISQDNEIISSWSWNQNHLQTLPFSASIIFLLLCDVKAKMFVHNWWIKIMFCVYILKKVVHWQKHEQVTNVISYAEKKNLFQCSLWIIFMFITLSFMKRHFCDDPVSFRQVLFNLLRIISYLTFSEKNSSVCGDTRFSLDWFEHFTYVQ